MKEAPEIKKVPKIKNQIDCHSTSYFTPDYHSKTDLRPDMLISVETGQSNPHVKRHNLWHSKKKDNILNAKITCKSLHNDKFMGTLSIIDSIIASTIKTIQLGLNRL